MADDEWQLEAISEQFNVLDTVKTPYLNISSNDFRRLMMEVADIKNNHLKMNNNTINSPRVISAEIMKHCDGDVIKLSFVVIVTNIKINGSLSKMPIFVIISGGNNKFIDMNLTVFNSWDAFLNNNDLPSCKFCFPVSGQYSSRSKLKIDFASSPAAVRENISFFWKGLGFVVAVGVVTASFFFEIPPIDHNRADSLLSIANEFVPGIKKYAGRLLSAVNLVQRYKSGNIDVVRLLPELWRILKWMYDEFGESISLIFQKVRTTLKTMYNWIKEKLSSFFKTASESEQHIFMAVTCRVDTEIVTIDSEAEELLEASRNNVQTVSVDAAAIHDQVDTEKDSGYVKQIFRNTKTESALESGKNSKGNGNLHDITSDLLSISDSLAEKLGKKTLKDAQDIFEALSNIVKDEFKNKIEVYNKMLTAARAAAGHEIDIDAFNESLGIKEDIKEHYWKEAIKTTMASRLAYSVKCEIEKLENQRKILILELYKKNEDDVSGLYRCTGVNGAGHFTANDLIKALKDVHVELNEDMLVINETSTMIFIRDEDLTIAALQELNSENTSESMLLIERIET